MIILFKADKSLVVSKSTRLYQKENAVDAVTFYCVTTYGSGYDLKRFTPTLSYVNATNDAYSELLEWADESDKDGFYQLSLPVTTKLTSAAGDITMHLTFTYQDSSTNTSYILKSSDLEITIESWEDYFRFTPNDAFSSIDNKILELDAEIQKLKSVEEQIQQATPDDLMLTGELLQLQKDGTAFGNGVQITIAPDDLDPVDDGISDLNDDVDLADVREGETAIINL